MPTNQQQIQTLLTKYGSQGLKTAKETLNNPNIPPPIKKIAHYFIEETWPNTHHPALMALSCEAVNGDVKKTHQVSAAIVLLTGAADIHDDIIDKSKTKTGKLTAYGKFNKELVLLTGDMLLFEGLILLHRTSEKLPTKTRQAVFDIVEQSFFKIGSAITSERCLRTKPVNLADYCNVIESKGFITQACTEIGAIIGQGKTSEIEALSQLGKTLGLLMTVKNEFADMQDPKELKGRLKNEILPLPLMYAYEDAVAKEKIQALLSERLNKQKIQAIAKIALETEQVKKLKQEMLAYELNEEKTVDSALSNNREAFKLLLKSSISYM
ncbi:MAG: polyprenyl synthetase family protein [Candidatus Bathyarchaeia archaeon]|jgi:geranylgeranyl pyrophosphate synthase